MEFFIRQRKLRVFIDRNTKGAEKMLRTSCHEGFCFGDLIPQLGEVNSAT